MKSANIEIDSLDILQELFGINDKLIKVIEKRLGVSITQRNSSITVSGTNDGRIRSAVNIIEAMQEALSKQQQLSVDMIHRFLDETDEGDDQDEDIAVITAEFAKMPALYIADGHHRSAAAALVGAEKAKQNPNHRGDEEYNYFMAVCFPANQLTIIDYNRVVKDLNGLTPEQFLTAVSKNFTVEEKGTEIYKPAGLHNFSLYLDGKWYSLTAKPGTYNDNDPIGVLDVTISSNLILDEVLGIKDLRSDKRIDFVGGIRGLGELKKRVDSGEMKVALALYPVSMKQLMDIADTGNIMPPKTTWFEPKLRSGLVIHKLD